MNFIDAYEVSGTATPSATTQADQPQQSLNEEVSQVIGQLNRFWGGFRKQSQTAIETARKDLGQVVEQAQKELSKLNGPAPAPAAESTSAEHTDPVVEDHSSPLLEQPDETSSSSSSTTQTPSQPSGSGGSAFSPQSLFTRLQTSLPPNLVSTVQSHIPPLESLRHAASESVDFAQLRTTLTSEFQRVQGVTRAQAEEYVHKSEDLIREAVKEAGDFLKDAVKVIPPEGPDRDASVGVVWDGSDVWMLSPSYSDSNLAGASSGKGKESEHSRSYGDARRAVATRAEALLRRLRHDPEVIKADPETDRGAKSLYDEWLRREVIGKGGIQSPEWMETRKTALNLFGDEDALIDLQNSLVPSVMSEDIFWTRYFFRAYQIDREAERRKALLQIPSDSEDAFSWEDDEEVVSPTHATLPLTGSRPDSTIAISGTISQAPPQSASPRESSEESFDVVSHSGEETSRKGMVTISAHDDENDEDNENENEDGDGDGDGSEDSDWE